MNEIIFAAAMLAAFLLGAYIRKPFAIAKKQEPEKTCNPKEDEYAQKVTKQINQMLAYTGRKHKGGDA